MASGSLSGHGISKTRKYYDKIDVEPAAFYGYGIITRFCTKNSSVLYTEPVSDPEILSQTLKDQKGEITTYILNKSDKEQSIRLSISGTYKKNFFLYTVTDEAVNKPDFRMDPVKEVILNDKKGIILKIPAQSISAFTNKQVKHDEPSPNR